MGAPRSFYRGTVCLTWTRLIQELEGVNCFFIITEHMHYKKLGRTDIQVSKICL